MLLDFLRKIEDTLRLTEFWSSKDSILSNLLKRMTSRIPEQNSILASAKVKKDIDRSVISSFTVPETNDSIYTIIHIVSEKNKNFKKLVDVV